MAIADGFTGMSAPRGGRRYDLDWLRVAAFGLLIFYHIGMFYVTWDWHVKSVHAGPAVEPAMLIVNPWRLALLFFISGVAVRFASDKRRAASFVGERAYRLGLPILFGMAVIVAPQSYFELREAGLIEAGFWRFWPDYLDLRQRFAIITPTWNHLWYVVYLLTYILLLAPFLPWLRRVASGSGGRAFGALVGSPARLILLAIVPFVGYALVLEPRYPTTHALWGDWANHAHRFSIFLLGYFAAKNERFWQSVDRARWAALGLFLALAGSGFLVEHYEAALSNSCAARIPFISAIMTGLDTLYAWSAILVLLGFAQRRLNRPSKALTYLTGAVFCYYILHQTAIVAAGYALTRAGFDPWTEFALVIVITVGSCGVGYELLRRIPYLRVLVGIKTRRADA